jgi:predicted RNA binding protein YcfA (HicA-like mRNA interferase family)
MKPLPYKKLIKILEARGFVIVRQKGSHVILKNLQTGKMVSVPLHGKNKPIYIGTFLVILKQAGIDPKEF